jgi:methionyl aminopeptidase
MDGAELERWRAAARIAARARELGAREARPGVGRRELAERIEGYIRDQGAAPAFPANLSRNEEAAHYTPGPDDAATLAVGDLLKIDVGAHLEGAIADTAITVEVGGGHRHEALRRAAVEAVEAGLGEVRSGARVDALSRAIASAIHRRGLKPIVDLTGHSIEPYLLHAGKAIPNVPGLSAETLEDGEIIAIEPFVTNGAGHIRNGPFGHIVRFRRDPGPAEPRLAPTFARFRTLPFALRWVDPPVRSLLRTAGRRYLQSYPVFVESAGGLVAQAEHTVRVTASGPEVLTRGPTE